MNHENSRWKKVAENVSEGIVKKHPQSDERHEPNFSSLMYSKKDEPKETTYCLHPTNRSSVLKQNQ